MAKQAPKKRPARKRSGNKKKKSNKKKQFFRLAALILIMFLVATVGAGLYFAFRREPTGQPAPVSRQKAAIIRQQPTTRPYEEPDLPSRRDKRPDPEPPAKSAPPPPLATRPAIKDIEAQKAAPAPARPRVAIIIDDMGHHPTIGRDLIGLDLNLTFAFLPYAPHTGEQLELASKRGRDIMLHVPMEPSDLKWDPGPDALYLNMTDAELKAAFARNLAAVPMAIGVNNHMGSRFTQNREAMHVFLTEVRRHNIFYLDSITTPYSVGQLIARELGIKNSRRDIFLDNSQDKKLTKKQLDALIRLAEKHGNAIGIGHPHVSTLAALRACQRQLRARVEVVGIHELVD